MKRAIVALILLSLMGCLGCGGSDPTSGPDTLDTEQPQLRQYEQNDGSGGAHLFGDSIFTTSDHRIRRQLESLAAITIQDHAAGGAVMSQIRDQYKSFRTQKIRTVLMDGGGNDILGNAGSCKNQLSDACRSIIKGLVTNLEELFAMMREDGVHQIVFLGCHYPTGWNAGFEQAVDYGYTLLAVACGSSAVPCLLVDPRQTIKNGANLLEWDGVHPNWNGTAVLAQLVWDEMQAHGVTP